MRFFFVKLNPNRRANIINDHGLTDSYDLMDLGILFWHLLLKIQKSNLKIQRHSHFGYKKRSKN